MRLYTRHGDSGDTNLLYGGRVSKSDPRCEAYGTVDEAVSALGLGRALVTDHSVKVMVERIQRNLFIVASELATAPEEYKKLETHFQVVKPEMTTEVELLIDSLTDQVELPRQFIVPGGTAGSGALDLARTIVRRAERRSVELHKNGSLRNPEIIRYLNRIADLLFIMARFEDRHLPIETVNNESQT